MQLINFSLCLRIFYDEEEDIEQEITNEESRQLRNLGFKLVLLKLSLLF